MTVEQAISDISALPLEEQLLVVQAIWDRMPQDAGTTLTDQQRAELDRRLESYRANPDSLLTESQLREQIRDARS
ncbi:addiction module protein [Crateriforma conspicua]|uniref:Putative addiction module component n=1 Tax=Crateriforma conspicua TaxID=2527996 RepID=A0A5C5YAE5_9PLAN|nr:addiction module protein [Crateriforma conspicua]QDV61655.1 Putative addiction module component [Crateriforma conspicua]TWT72094.1 putative addiction module component [Crateriforma conspicua]